MVQSHWARCQLAFRFVWLCTCPSPVPWMTIPSFSINPHSFLCDHLKYFLLYYSFPELCRITPLCLLRQFFYIIFSLFIYYTNFLDQTEFQENSENVLFIFVCSLPSTQSSQFSEDSCSKNEGIQTCKHLMSLLASQMLVSGYLLFRTKVHYLNYLTFKFDFLFWQRRKLWSKAWIIEKGLWQLLVEIFMLTIPSLNSLYFMTCSCTNRDRHIIRPCHATLHTPLLVSHPVLSYSLPTFRHISSDILTFIFTSSLPLKAGISLIHSIRGKVITFISNVRVIL